VNWEISGRKCCDRITVLFQHLSEGLRKPIENCKNIWCPGKDLCPTLSVVITTLIQYYIAILTGKLRKIKTQEGGPIIRKYYNQIPSEHRSNDLPLN
jgi:hypothetical protein